MLTIPIVSEYPAVPYVAIRTQVSPDELERVGNAACQEVVDWLAARGLHEVGGPFWRYRVIAMGTGFEMEFGVRTSTLLEGDDRVTAGMLPAGRYASAIHTGHYDELYDATAMFIGWAKERGIEWDHHDSPEGDVFESRLEIYHTDPDKVPRATDWRTEITIKLAD